MQAKRSLFKKKTTKQEPESSNSEDRESADSDRATRNSVGSGDDEDDEDDDADSADVQEIGNEDVDINDAPLLNYEHDEQLIVQIVWQPLAELEY